MKKYIRKAIIVSLVIILIIIAIIATFFIVRNANEKGQIEYVKEAYSEETTQERLNVVNDENIILNIDNEKAIGTIKIDRINFEGIVYEGTSLDTLKKGVGHFENSPYFNGNVALAAHNTSKFWEKLHTLQNGDKITYTSFLGTRTYAVYDIVQIDETDWTRLENTDENILTLITCVKGNKPKRLCVQALEVD